MTTNLIDEVRRVKKHMQHVYGMKRRCDELYKRGEIWRIALEQGRATRAVTGCGHLMPPRKVGSFLGA